MDVTESLATARDAVKDAALPDEWQVPAFIEVLRHLMTDGVTRVQGGGGGAGNGNQGSQRHSAITQSASEPPAGRLAARVKVDEGLLADVFDFTEEGVKLHVASSKIASSKSKATQEVALLITAARQASGLDAAGWTSGNFVRDALQHYNRYDQSNFSTNLGAVENAFNTRGRGPSLELRLTQPGWEAAIELVRRVAGAAE